MRPYMVVIKPIWFVFRRLMDELCNFCWNEKEKIGYLLIIFSSNDYLLKKMVIVATDKISI